MEPALDCFEKLVFFIPKQGNFHILILAKDLNLRKDIIIVQWEQINFLFSTNILLLYL